MDGDVHISKTIQGDGRRGNDGGRRKVGGPELWTLSPIN